MALKRSGGSSTDYQEVQQKLKGLEDALLQHHQLLQARKNDPALDSIFKSTQSRAEDCQKFIEVFSKQTVKFDKSLGTAKGANIAKDVAMKVRWQMSRRDEAARFRGELAQHALSLNMLYGMANM